MRSTPGFADAHLAYAIALAERGKSAPAEKEFTATLALAPQHHEAQLRLGQLLLARGATAQATPHLRKAAESKDARIREAANRLLSTLK